MPISFIPSGPDNSKDPPKQADTPTEDPSADKSCLLPNNNTSPLSPELITLPTSQDLSLPVYTAVPEDTFGATIAEAWRLQQEDKVKRATEIASDLRGENIEDTSSGSTPVTQERIRSALDRSQIPREYWEKAANAKSSLNPEQILAKVQGSIVEQEIKKQLEDEAAFEARIEEALRITGIPYQVRNLLTSIDQHPEKFCNENLQALFTFRMHFYGDNIPKSSYTVPVAVGIIASFILTAAPISYFFGGPGGLIASVFGHVATVPTLQFYLTHREDELIRQRIENSNAFKRCLAALENIEIAPDKVVRIAPDQVKIKLVAMAGKYYGFDVCIFNFPESK
jgi:hypothetical protein